MIDMKCMWVNTGKMFYYFMSIHYSISMLMSFVEIVHNELIRPFINWCYIHIRITDFLLENCLKMNSVFLIGTNKSPDQKPDEKY